MNIYRFIYFYSIGYKYLLYTCYDLQSSEEFEFYENGKYSCSESDASGDELYSSRGTVE